MVIILGYYFKEGSKEILREAFPFRVFGVFLKIRAFMTSPSMFLALSLSVDRVRDEVEHSGTKARVIGTH